MRCIFSWILIILPLIIRLPAARAAATVDVASNLSAMRISGAVTGGLLNYNDPEFSEMVTDIQAGDYYDAAMVAVNSKYFGTYLAHRIALEMMTPSLDPAGLTDNDATTFLIANFIGSSTTANISKIWSDNATYLVRVVRNGTPTTLHVLDLTSAELSAVDWRSQIVRIPGQNAEDLAAFSANNNVKQNIAIPARDVGGYVTLSDRDGDLSFAQYGATGGTNLRFIEGIWEISMGLTLTQVASTSATIEEVPRFVPTTNANMFHGQGQPACISCHGGGMSSLNHGYSTVADLFDYDNAGKGQGFSYNTNLTPNLMKSLGSNPGQDQRLGVLNCNLSSKYNVCNPESLGADPTQAWDVGTTWQADGTLAQMGWNGPTTGQGLNSLGVAIGQATLVYQNLTNRVINDVCPTGSIPADEIGSIAQQAQAADSLKTLVALVASQPSCH